MKYVQSHQYKQQNDVTEIASHIFSSIIIVDFEQVNVWPVRGFLN